MATKGQTRPKNNQTGGEIRHIYWWLDESPEVTHNLCEEGPPSEGLPPLSTMRPYWREFITCTLCKEIMLEQAPK